MAGTGVTIMLPWKSCRPGSYHGLRLFAVRPAPDTHLWVRDVVDYTERIPAQKVLLGRVFTAAIGQLPVKKQCFGAQTGQLGFRSNRAAGGLSSGIEMGRQSYAPYFTYTDDQGQLHTVWYESIVT